MSSNPQPSLAATTPPSSTTCFHCGLPVPRGVDHRVVIKGMPRAMCCLGCTAVAHAIVTAGLDDFYSHRTATAPTARELVPEVLRQLELYDHPDIQKSFVRTTNGHVREASLILEGITCAACVWLNERHLAALPGVLEVSANYATHRARIQWDDTHIKLSEILEAVTRIGYIAHPYDPNRQQDILARERKQQLRRLGLAGVLGMQVMVLAEALYAGDYFGIEASFRGLFNWLSFGLTLPVLLYSAQPFFRAAWRDLRQHQAGMDVPVSLGISVAFAGSVWNTVQGSGAVYYDSVVMFVFFLLTARYFELIARVRATEAQENLVRMVPAMATRITAQGDDIVPVAELQPGDRVRVRPGESLPADGHVLEGHSSVDEALLTGESTPIAKTVGDAVIGGSVNIEGPLIMRVQHTGADTVLSAVLRLLDRAQSEKPRLTQLADRAASWFVGAVLLLAVGVALYWLNAEPARWLPITLSVLVVTCPCALSLATPAALTAATGRLTRLGLLTTRGHALETLARATHVIFDKTGTLTSGRPRLVSAHCFATHSTDDCLRIAAALEAHSEHPIAQAIRAAAGSFDTSAATEVVNTPGAGILGRVEKEFWYLGTDAFIATHTGLHAAAATIDELRRDGHSVVLLANDEHIAAALQLADTLRPGAQALVKALQDDGKTVMLMSGDHAQAVQPIAATLGIAAPRWEQTPADKLAAVQSLQRDGAVVAMVGDGVNDAPVLAAAQVSIAMGGGTAIAAASADMLLLSDHLEHLVDGLRIAHKTLRIIRENLIWAVAYNLIALPAAAFGWVAPWMAAIGMSASSLLVVLNALRLTGGKN